MRDLLIRGELKCSKCEEVLSLLTLSITNQKSNKKQKIIICKGCEIQAVEEVQQIQMVKRRTIAVSHLQKGFSNSEIIDKLMMKGRLSEEQASRTLSQAYNHILKHQQKNMTMIGSQILDRCDKAYKLALDSSDVDLMIKATQLKAKLLGMDKNEIHIVNQSSADGKLDLNALNELLKEYEDKQRKLDVIIDE